MIFKTKEDLRKRIVYIWDCYDKDSDVDFILEELWKDIEETKVKNLVKPDVSGELLAQELISQNEIKQGFGEETLPQWAIDLASNFR